jgi:AmmeMemoRadiSam system protein A
LDYRNSGDTAGGKASVVGYAAIAFFAPTVETPAPERKFSREERRQLLMLARQAVAAAASGRNGPDADGAAFPNLRTRQACFVTLTKQHALRGCIGTLAPQEPLCEAVVRRARSAAIEDPRFSPVEPGELEEIQIEISVLSLPVPLPFASPQDLLARLRPTLDGVVLRAEGRSATYLPQVWEQLPDAEEFMNELARKAGLSPDAWRRPGAEVLTYQVEAFKEGEVGD